MAHSSSSIKGKRFAVILSFLFFIVGSIGAIGSWMTYRLDTDIQKNGPKAAGHVTKKSFLKSDDGDSDYLVEYDFALPSGTQIHATRGISKKLWSTVQKGQTLTIAYSQENPKRNFPLGEGVTSLNITVFASLFSAVFAIFGGLIFWPLVFTKPSQRKS